MLKNIGIIAWAGCLMVLAYQGIYWMLYASWPSITLFDAYRTIGFDTVSLIQSMPLEMATKIVYLCFTTELPIFLWCIGAFFFAFEFAIQIFTKK